MLVHILLTEYVVRVYAQCIVMDMESRLTLLGLLSAGPGHGYDLKRSWDHWFAASKPLAYGQVYATLARLVRDGLITQIETEPGAGRSASATRSPTPAARALSSGC